MILRWSPFRIVSNDPAHQPRLPTSADIISSPDLKGHMSYCYHWHPSSIVRPSLAFHIFIFSSELLGQMEPNLAGSIYGEGSFIKFVHFDLTGQQTWPPWATLNSEWLSFQKSSPLKPLDQMKPNFARSLYGRSFIKFVHFIPIGQQTWPPWAILNSDWLSFQKSSPVKLLGQMEPNVGRKHLWEVLYKVCLFRLDRNNKNDCHGQFLILIGWVFKNLLLWNRLAKWNQTLQEASMGCSFIKFVHFSPDRTTNMAAMAWAILNSDWPTFQKSSPLKPLGQMEPNFASEFILKWEVLYKIMFIKSPDQLETTNNGHHGQFLFLIGWVFKMTRQCPMKLLCQMEPNFAKHLFFIKFVHFILIGQQTWLPWAIY